MARAAGHFDPAAGMSALDETSRFGCPQRPSIPCQAATAKEPLDVPIALPCQHQRLWQRCADQRKLADVIFDMPFCVRSGREEDRIPCTQTAGGTCPVREDNTALDHIDRLIRLVEPVEPPCAAVPDVASCVTISTDRQQLVACHRASFQHPAWTNGRWHQVCP